LKEGQHVHVEVIRLALGQNCAFGVLKGQGYRKLIVNEDYMPDRPLTPEEREAGINDYIALLEAESDAHV
jgi:hypothetical protein